MMPKDDLIEKINIKLFEFNEPALTKEEEEMFETIDDLLYLYQMNNSNRREFRDTVKKTKLF